MDIGTKLKKFTKAFIVIINNIICSQGKFKLTFNQGELVPLLASQFFKKSIILKTKM